MTLKDLIAEARATFCAKWEEREGRAVPEAEDVKLCNDAVVLDGTVLYADMNDSTGLVDGYKAWFAAEIFKTYLAGASRIIRENNGEVTAFDGDRVMAVFTSDRKNSSAAKSALQVNAFVKELNKAIKTAYPKTSYVLQQTIGIDTSKLFIARTGVRKYNDLVWVGRAANYAAKLCSAADSTYPTYITEDVFKKLSKEVKYGGTEGRLMWERSTWDGLGVTVYRSNWLWSF